MVLPATVRRSAPARGAVFSTILGALPPIPDATIEETIERNVIDLEGVGLELLADGLPPASPAAATAESVVARWRAAAAATSRPVKASVVGPFSGAGASVDGVRAVIDALLDAGCPFVEVAEPDATAIATSAEARERFLRAHEGLLGFLAPGGDAHLSLALTGGNHDGVGAELFGLPYASFAFDLIAGPDDWRLIAAAPGERGIVCGALDPAESGDETREVLIWAAHYAASTAGRGTDRIGLANAPSLAGTSRDAALRKLHRVAEAVRVASVESAEELAKLLDPRAFGGRRNRPGGPEAPGGPQRGAPA
jgi:hypothetical protein